MNLEMEFQKKVEETANDHNFSPGEKHERLHAYQELAARFGWNDVAELAREKQNEVLKEGGDQ